VGARLRGVDARHPAWPDLGQRLDDRGRAVDNGFILMTNNTADFTALYGREELHVGLVCLNAAPGTMSLDLQKRLFLLALAELEEAEPYNEVLEITASAKGEITVDRYDLP
jgi:hypothetical protein